MRTKALIRHLIACTLLGILLSSCATSTNEGGTGAQAAQFFSHSAANALS